MVWFFVGLAADRIYIYPPGLLLLSIGAISTGIYRMRLAKRLEARKSARKRKRSS